MSAAPEQRTSSLRWAGRAVAGIIAVAFVVLLGWGLANKSADTEIDDSLAEGKSAPAPSWNLPLVLEGDAPPRLRARLDRAVADDEKVSLSELRGVPIALNFWASWCIPCRDEAPELERGWRVARRTGVLLLGLNMQDLSDDARAFARDEGLTYPSVRDRGNDVSRDYGVTGVPETFFISGTGRIVGHVIGVVQDAQMREGLAAARADRVVGASRGGAQGATRRAPPPARRPEGD